MTPTCAKCDRPFPANGELVSLPHGRRIAFDPELNRVWRICTKCGEWNLVGAESGSVVIQELHARLPAVERGAIVHDMVGAVDVLTVTNAPDAVPGSSDAVRARRAFGVDGWRDWLVPGGGVLIVLWLLVEPGVLRSEWTFTFRILSQGCATFGALVLGKQLARIGRRGPRLKGLAAGALLLALHVLFANLAGPGRLRWKLILITMAVGVAVYRSRLFTPPVHLPSGAKLRLHDGEIAAVWFGFDREGRAMMAAVPSQELVLHGADAHALLYALATRCRSVPTRADTEQAWAILRTSRGIDGVMQAVGQLRPDDHGRHKLQGLPASWRLALLFGVIEDSGTLEERETLRDQIAAASEVAAIGESLDSPRLT